MMLNNNHPDKHALGITQIVMVILVFIIATLHSPFMGLGLLFTSWMISESMYFGILAFLAIVLCRGLQNIRRPMHHAH